jgi:hypothetical protein
MANIPTKGYRVINGRIWWFNIYPNWKNYCAARAIASKVSPSFTPPQLSGPGGEVYFTDYDSLMGMQDEMDFARRTGLSASSVQSCYLFGCVVVEFETAPYYSAVNVPVPHSTCQRGLTVGGAREWIIPSHAPVYLHEQMNVTCYHSTNSGPVSFDLAL